MREIVFPSLINGVKNDKKYNFYIMDANNVFIMYLDL